MEKGFVRKVWKAPVETQREMLRASGLQASAIYEHGKDAEDIDACIMSFRDQGGTLKIAADFRVFGESQREITKAVDKCELARIRIIDLSNPELKTIAAQQRHAFSKLSGDARWGRDKKRAKRTGKDGGDAKALYAAARRAERVPDDTISKLIWIVENRVVMTWVLLEWALGGKPFSVGTMRRHYTASAPPPKPKSRKARK